MRPKEPVFLKTRHYRGIVGGGGGLCYVVYREHVEKPPSIPRELPSKPPEEVFVPKGPRTQIL